MIRIDWSRELKLVYVLDECSFFLSFSNSYDHARF